MLYGITTPLVKVNRITKLVFVKSTEYKYDDFLEVIAVNLKRIRKSKGLTQRDMERHGFDLRNYQRLEAGNHSPSLYTIHKLSLAFKVDVAEFFRTKV